MIIPIFKGLAECVFGFVACYADEWTALRPEINKSIAEQRTYTEFCREDTSKLFANVQPYSCPGKGKKWHHSEAADECAGPLFPGSEVCFGNI